MSQTLQIILGILAIIGAIGGFLKWHYSEFNKLKEHLNKLEKEMERLKGKDELQQQTIDQLKELYPVFKNVIETLNNKK
jgi:uncharacterized protein YdcH (DUF465 family)